MNNIPLGCQNDPNAPWNEPDDVEVLEKCDFCAEEFKELNFVVYHKNISTRLYTIANINPKPYEKIRSKKGFNIVVQHICDNCLKEEKNDEKEV